jgi:hypothetical protein
MAIPRLTGIGPRAKLGSPAVLLDKATLDGIAEGRITLAFRRWQRPMVKPGGTQRTPIGVLGFGRVEEVEAAAITDEEARRAGARDRAALLKRLRPEGRIYRVELAVAGEDPRVALRAALPTEQELDELGRRLGRMDRASPTGPWTTATLRLIAERPEVRAADLAPELGLERLPFKARVRRLKELGLTESLERGYRLSPRGAAYLRTVLRS